MKYENILVEQENSIQIITINRPSKLNALNQATIEELSCALRIVEEDQSIRVIIITGSGEKAFVAGADISEFANFSIEEGTTLSQKGHDELFTYIDQMKTPVIAAVNGFALGGGLELAMAAHVRIFSDTFFQARILFYIVRTFVFSDHFLCIFAVSLLQFNIFSI